MSTRIEKFNELLLEDNQEKINNYLFCYSICLTLDEFRYMVENGADPRINNDRLFIEICSGKSVEYLLYLINQCGADINAQNGKALSRAIKYGNIPVIKFLLESGIVVSDNAIKQAIQKQDSIIAMMMEHGVDPERIAKIFWKHYMKYYDFIIGKIGLLSKFGVDLNQSIDNCLKK